MIFTIYITYIQEPSLEYVRLRVLKFLIRLAHKILTSMYLYNQENNCNKMKSTIKLLDNSIPVSSARVLNGDSLIHLSVSCQGNI